MRFFHDAEFLEDGTTIELISYAILADNGDHLYLINLWADWERVSAQPWLRENVLPHLPGWWDVAGKVWRPDAADPRVVSKAAIADRVRQFVSSFGHHRNMHELWAWYGAYDYVALAQLFGPMMNLPDAVPMHTNDLKTLVGRLRVPDSLRDADEHDALADCRFNQRLYHWAVERKAAGFRENMQATVEASEVYRQLLAISAAWEGLDPATRERIRALAGDRYLPALLSDAKAVLEP